MSAQTAPSSQFSAASSSSAVAKGSLAIWYWAAAGVFFIGLEAWIFWQWYASGDMRFVNPGKTEIETWMYLMIVMNDIFWYLCILTVAWVFVIGPKLRTGKFSFDGLFVLSFATLWWQDPIFGFGSQGWSYSTTSINLGSWACHIPGWQSPGGCNVSEPLSWDFSFYFVLSAMAAIVGSMVMRKIKARFPALRDQWLWLGFGFIITIFDFILEFSWVSMGMYHYAGINEYLSIFDDTRFKFPLFEGPLIGWLVSLWTAILYYRNDKGETLAERGLSQVQATGGKRTLIRFLALSGCVNAMFIIGYSMTSLFFQYHAGPWPEETQDRSYFTNGICGDGTTIVCGTTNMPVPAAGYVHIGPNLEVVVPSGRSLPKVVPQE